MHARFLALALALAAVPAAAQQDFSKVEVTVEKIAPGVAVLFGSGGNIGLSYGEDGNVIVDDQYAPLTDKIAAAIATLDRGPVKFVINTHWHGDHTGGNENFGKRGSVIVAHDNVRTRMSTDQVMKAWNETVKASPTDALPVLTFGNGATIHLNGDALHMVHVANAHTDGDVLVHWQKADVIHMGDAFMHKVSFPFIDTGSGGSIDGFIAAANRALEMSTDKTRIIPGHGPMATRANLVWHRDMLVDVRTKVAAGIAAGRTLDQIKTQNLAAPHGMTDGFIKPDDFVSAVYESLMNPPSAAHSHSDGKPHQH